MCAFGSEGRPLCCTVNEWPLRSSLVRRCMEKARQGKPGARLPRDPHSSVSHTQSPHLAPQGSLLGTPLSNLIHHPPSPYFSYTTKGSPASYRNAIDIRIAAIAARQQRVSASGNHKCGWLSLDYDSCGVVSTNFAHCIPRSSPLVFDFSQSVAHNFA